MSRWREVTLGELCDRITSGGTPKRTRADYYSNDGDGHSWVKSSELADGYVRGTVERLTDRGLEESTAKLLPIDSVLIAMYGATAGRVGLLKLNAAVNQAVCALVLDGERAHPVFVFHTLRSVYPELAASAAGAAQQNLNAGIVRSFRILAPDYAIQRRIASLLSAFDELIEINERRIELLEDLARSLYREWFVHFRFPGHEDVELVDSEMGPIPDGWMLHPFGELAQVITHGVDPGDVSPDEPYVGLEHLPRRQTTLREWGAIASVTSRKLRFARGDTLFGKIRPYFHKVAWAPFDGVASSDTVVLRPNRKPDARALTNAISSSDAFVAQAVATSNGTKMPRADPAAMIAYAVPLPERGGDLLRAYEDAGCRWLEHAASLVIHNRQLAATRDLLLPRLVTGRLDISDVDLGELLPAEAA